jgi:hypothetical protein
VLKSIALSLAAACVATGACAQARPSALAMSCRATAQLVAARGTVVLGTGGWTYDRVVRDGSFCLRDETIRPVWTPTAESSQCFVGYRCVSGDLEVER